MPSKLFIFFAGRKRAKRRAPESTRKRKLGGNSADHRPFFTYWMTTVQIFIMLISIAVYGIGPIGIDLYKKSGMVSAEIAESKSLAMPLAIWLQTKGLEESIKVHYVSLSQKAAKLCFV